MKHRMDKIDTQVLPAPPNLLVSIKTGFDAVANQIAVILIPLAIDLFLWLGPHLQVKSIILNFLNRLSSSQELSSIGSGDLFSSSMELVRTAAEEFNLFSLLRTIPVGVPSLMSGRSPVEVPVGSPLFLDITNLILVITIIIMTLVLGLLIGSFYYGLVAQVAIQGKMNLKEVMKSWPKSTLQVLGLSLALLILFIVISIPSSCAISVVTLFGLPLGQFAIFLYIGIMLWLSFPLLFSAHGIFVNHNTALVSVQRSMLLTRMTLPSTSIFIILILVISEGLDLLWRVPPEASWLMLIGVGGHAFISSALLAASFIYYRDADQWTQGAVKLMSTQQVLQKRSS
jgi:hypothetical protein